MARTKNVPQRNEGAAARVGHRAATALATVPAPVPHPNAPPLGAGASRPSGVTLKLEEEKEEEEGEGEEGEEGPRRDGAVPEPARVSVSGPRADLAAAPAPHRYAPTAEGAGGTGVTLVKEEGAEETLAQQRDWLALALAHGPVRVDSHIKVEDTTGGEDSDGEQGAEWEEGVGTGGEGGLVLLAGAAHVLEDERGRSGAPRRSTPADRAARAKRGRIAAGDEVRDVPAPKRKDGGAKAGQSGRHGVDELTGGNIRKATPWLIWRAQLMLPKN